MQSNLIDLEVCVHHETKPGVPDEGALLVSDDGDSENGVWVPKSLLEYEQTKGQYYTITLPEHIAQDKGLI